MQSTNHKITKREELTIVIVGWHFKNYNLYQDLIKEAMLYNNLKVNFYIASHSQPNKISESIKCNLKKMGWKLLFFENKGWDWGAFQQFTIWQKQNESLTDYYLFLHDDIIIKNKDFVGAFLNKIQNGAKVVGNSFPSGYPPIKKDWGIILPEVMFWSQIKGFPINSKSWGCVRGSCFFTVKDVIENILIRMPIKQGFHVGFGNWSCTIFGGLATDKYGENAIDYIGGKKERESYYITEEFRGGEEKILIFDKIKSLIPAFIKKIIKGQRAPSPPNGLKLNLGCGEKYLEHYLNIDINDKYADLAKDILDLEFEKETIAVVLMIHVVEHIDYFKINHLFEKIYYWLKKDGQLIIEFPDIIKVAKHILAIKNDIKKPQNSTFGLRGIYGQPTKNMTMYDYHKWGWSKKTIVKLLQKIGFRKIYVEKPQYHGCLKSRDTRIVAIK
jgi:SAM-dependent methyltransferase